MEGIINVTPDELRAAAGEFSSEAAKVNNIANEMLDKVSNLASMWEGETSNAYRDKFAKLREDTDLMYRMITEHADDLEKMAEEYDRTEKANIDLAQSLENNILQ